MFPDDHDEMGAGETAIAYADDFLDAAVAKLDATFGQDYARANPALVAGYVQACAANLNSFMLAASNLPAGMEDMLSAMLDQAANEEPAPKPKRRK
ncbi:hypothetical protein [Paracoccus marinaquae]|uniref:Uncharacterized protein n=1 Tax=Paracoccus marinaquae TaxID=2841926 RepID=A0ABS6AJJ3_9RHOB|nr:hypothetical protein [Paracoccus marinaquae]MBU3030067.1 hypothetical protein [Paracoccus marinaquae]